MPAKIKTRAGQNSAQKMVNQFAHAKPWEVA